MDLSHGIAKSISWTQHNTSSPVHTGIAPTPRLNPRIDFHQVRRHIELNTDENNAVIVLQSFYFRKDVLSVG